MKKIIAFVIIALGAALMITGFREYVPSRTFSAYSVKEYYGGDCYNGIVESGIRGGEIAGTSAAKAVYVGTGAVTLSIGLALLSFALDKKKQAPAVVDSAVRAESASVSATPAFPTVQTEEDSPAQEKASSEEQG